MVLWNIDKEVEKEAADKLIVVVSYVDPEPSIKISPSREVLSVACKYAEKNKITIRLQGRCYYIKYLQWSDQITSACLKTSWRAVEYSIQDLS